MVKRYGKAYPVFFGVFQSFPDEKAVVEDVVVGQCSSFGMSGGTRSILDIHRVVKLQGGFPFSELLVADIVTGLQKSFPVLFDNDGLFRISTVGFELFQHAYVVRFPEVGGGYQKVDTALFQGVAQSRQLVSGIDVYHDGTHQSRRVLHYDPFISVRRPYSYPVASFYSLWPLVRIG